MNGKGSGLAEVGLFLLLAFVLPGYVYLGFFIFYFPEIYSSSRESFGFQGDSGLFTFFLGVLGGLLLTSICFAIELLLRKIKYFDKSLFPNMRIGRLSVIEAKGKGSLHIRQVTGQAIMHFNIALGLLVPIVPLYIYFQRANTSEFYVKLLIGVVLIAANFFIANKFYNWGKSGLDKIDKIDSRHKRAGLDKRKYGKKTH
jgi:hypothetical protein